MSQSDALVRIALAAMAADLYSGLTPADRASIRALPQQRTPLMAQDRARWKDILLAWARARVPGAVERIAEQFPQEEG
jgi:hypothetical protein